MGHAYLAHIRQPVFGPPYSHPTVRSSEGERIVKAHFIGANSPKDDPNYYVAAAKDLMVQYRILSRSHPQCPLIINYPGWIFGLGLEIASELIGSLGLTDVVYMSENGPSEVVEPLTVAAQQAGIAMTVLPSQPTEYVARSSSQLRTMQMMSYFHSASKQGADGLVWSDVPLCQDPPVVVSYAGKDRGILSVVVTGASHPPEFLKDILDGAVVGVVAIDDIDAIPSFAEHQVAFAAAQQTVDDGQDVEMAEDAEEPTAEPASEPAPAPNDDQDDEAVEDTEKPPA
ncbi:Polynucleotide 5'-hydroxyl-kinase grc3, partial [Ascosphaera atra]